MTWKTCCYCSC